MAPVRISGVSPDLVRRTVRKGGWKRGNTYEIRKRYRPGLGRHKSQTLRLLAHQHAHRKIMTTHEPSALSIGLRHNERLTVERRHTVSEVGTSWPDCQNMPPV